MKLNSLISAVIMITIAVSCVEQPVVLPEKTVNTSGKVLLLEDVTGVQCSNCPRASARLEEISAENPGSIVVIGVHGTQQTDPHPDSKYNFSNDDAVALEEYLKPWQGKPAVSYNRTLFPDAQGNLSIIGEVEISSRVEELLALPQTVNIETEYVYDEDTRTITISAGATALVPLEGDFYLSAMVTESHILDYQLDVDFGGYNPEYEHNHVLRDIISSPFGDQITSDVEAGDIIAKSWTYVIPSDEDGIWIVENLEFVVFLTNHSGGSKEVLQAAKFKIK